MALELPSARPAADLLNTRNPGTRASHLLRFDSGLRIRRLFHRAPWSETPSMKHQIIAGAGLAAVIAFCTYMIVQLDARRSREHGISMAPTAMDRH